MPDPSIWIPVLGLSASLAALGGTAAAALAYTGASGERYSPLNHFVSELGDPGVSRLARVFNLSLVAAGLLLAACCVVIGLSIAGWLARLALVFGVGAGVALALVGVFPMHRLTAHIRAAMNFFRLGLVMVLLFTVAITGQNQPAPPIPRASALAGLPAILSYAAFLLYGTVRGRVEGGLGHDFAHRPRVWPLAAIEWLVFLTTILWFAGIAAGVSAR